MIKVEETTIQNGPLITKGYKAKLDEGVTEKYEVRYHIDKEVGDVFDLLADLSKMVWLLNRKIEGKTTPEDEELEVKLKTRMTDIDNILSTYYTK
jgi:hypothetical protein